MLTLAHVTAYNDGQCAGRFRPRKGTESHLTDDARI